MMFKLKPVVFAIIALASAFLAHKVMAQGRTYDPPPVVPASPEITPINPGFQPPGLNKLRQQMGGHTEPQKEVATRTADKEPPPPVRLLPQSPSAQSSGSSERPAVQKSSSASEPAAMTKHVSVSRNAFSQPLAPSVPIKPESPELVQAIASMNEPVINAKPGEPVTIAIGLGTLNRIVTPFNDAVVDTVANLVIKKAGGVVMVASNVADPASMIIRERESPELAIIVNVVPKYETPARDVRIAAPFLKRSAKADASEKDTAPPLAVKLKNIMRDLAKGQIPSGFTMDKGNSAPASCRLPGFDTKEAQVFAGSGLVIRVYSAMNLADGDNELDERGCSGRKQLAAAAWPRLALRPGEKTELFVIETSASESSEASTRPSVID